MNFGAIEHARQECFVITQWKHRPKNAPREIHSKWPGITYPDEHGCQARITLDDGARHSRYFAYSTYQGDAVAAHRDAMKWFTRMLKHHRKHGQEATRVRERHQQWLAGGGARVMAMGG